MLTRQSAPLADAPWWVRSVVWVGVPTAAMAYLMWFVLGNFAGQMSHLSSSYDQHQQDTASLIQHLQQETEQAWAQLAVMQRICLNTAKTDADRLACVSIARRTP